MNTSVEFFRVLNEKDLGGQHGKVKHYYILRWEILMQGLRWVETERVVMRRQMDLMMQGQTFYLIAYIFSVLRFEVRSSDKSRHVFYL